jgi:hypothetical protein
MAEQQAVTEPQDRIAYSTVILLTEVAAEEETLIVQALLAVQVAAQVHMVAAQE